MMPDRRPILYLAGKMRGEDGLNFDTFDKYAERLRSKGYLVINPAETMGGDMGIPRKICMEIDAAYVGAADAVVLIPGWQDSPGAKLEAILAHNLEIPTFSADTLAPITITDYNVEVKTDE